MLTRAHAFLSQAYDMRHFCACIRGTNVITIFIAAIAVMTESSTSVAMPIAAAASLPTALFIIVAIVVVLFIMVFLT